LATTNRDLEQEIKNGNFREDLYYRLNVVPVDMPALRNHAHDIPDLVDYFVNLLSRQSGFSSKNFSAGALSALQSYHWPGNVRQLRNVIEWILIMQGGNKEQVELDHLPPEIRGRNSGVVPMVVTEAMSDIMSLPLREAREAFER